MKNTLFRFVLTNFEFVKSTESIIALDRLAPLKSVLNKFLNFDLVKFAALNLKYFKLHPSNIISAASVAKVDLDKLTSV